MLRSYLKIAYRNLLKNKVFSLINIFGLAIGMVACLLILQYVQYELSYDNFHENGDRIYRVGVAWYYPTGELEENDAGNFGAAGPAMKADIPEVEAFARFRPWFGNTLIKYEDVTLPQEHIYFADPSVFTIFSFPILQGDAENSLEEAHAAVISESTALKYFGNADPIGKSIELQQDSTVRLFTVKAVFQDVPANTHFTFDVLLSYKNLGEFAETDWGFSIANTYVLLQPHTDLVALQEKFQQLLHKYRETTMENATGEVQFILQPLRDIYLYSDLRDETVSTGQGQTLYFLVLIGVLILCIAYANYINLAIARATERAKEIGVRQAIGASKATLIGQFLLESFMINALAIILTVTLVQVLQVPFSQLTGQPSDLSLQEAPLFWLSCLGFFVVGSLASGMYPAFMLTSFNPVLVLKGKLLHTMKGRRLRKSLVVFQFGISVAMIIGTLLVYQQLTFMRDQKLGVAIEQIVVLKTPIVTDATFYQKTETFKKVLGAIPDVLQVTASTEVPGRNITWSNDLIHRKDVPSELITSNYIVGVDHDFVETYDLQLIAGRDFDERFGTDLQGLIINEKAARLMGFENVESAIGQPMVWDYQENSKDFTIIGVVKNYHQLGLQHDYDPMILTLQHQQESFYSCKIQGENLTATLQAMQHTYQQFFSDNPFSYFFLDEFFNQQYQTDQQFGRVLLLFSGLAILVACLGLLGLVTFTTSQRTKEIGVRKILGASVSSIVTLLSKDFIRLILLASLLALPLTYFAMQQWLENYAFRIGLQWWFFLLPVGIVVLIALLTISLQTIRSALANPADALRYE
ncbi:MAG: ABC transporter permease [Cyclobacteriaceae bacterium]